MYRLISCCLLLLLAGCVSKNGFDRDDGESPGGDPVSVAYLKSLYRGYPLRVTDDVELRVVVTANDAYGAFRNTLVVQDATGGIEVKVRADAISLPYFPGQGRAYGSVAGAGCLGDYGGVVSLGAASDDSAYENGFIPQSVWPQFLKKQGGVTDIRPDTLVFSDLAAAWISRYVAFERVQFVDAECSENWCDTMSDTDRHLVDPAGDTLIVRTSRRPTSQIGRFHSGSGYIEGVSELVQPELSVESRIAEKCGDGIAPFPARVCFRLLIVALQGFPEHVFELSDVVPADRRDKDRRNVRQIGGDGFLQFFVQQVAFGDRQQALLVEQFGVVLFQFVQQDAVFFAHVFRVGRDHEQQDRVAFDVTQEARSEPFAGMRPFDDAGDVGHHERLVVAAFDDAQIRFEGRESVIRDFWASPPKRLPAVSISRRSGIRPARRRQALSVRG